MGAAQALWPVTEDELMMTWTASCTLHRLLGSLQLAKKRAVHIGKKMRVLGLVAQAHGPTKVLFWVSTSTGKFYKTEIHDFQSYGSLCAPGLVSLLSCILSAFQSFQQS
jgi:hypothetical protein